MEMNFTASLSGPLFSVGQIMKIARLSLLLTYVTILHANARGKEGETPLKHHAIENKIDVRGQVVDENGKPMSGVSVTIKGTNIGITTDSKGHFALKAVDELAILKVSFIGYASQELKVKAILSIKLLPQSNNINELVVVGYGVQKKTDLTGAVGVIDIKKSLISRPVTNVQELLAGTVPGLNVAKTTGAVGSGATLNIRGTSTIGGSSGVLVLIDGFPGDINTLNPNDIENVSVLKDAASASIYGSRAANGVMLVTTKKGKQGGKTVVEVNSSIGLQRPQFRLDFVGAADYMKLWDQALINDGKEAIYGKQGLADLATGKYPDNKWYREIYKKNAFISTNSVAISGSEGRITYRVSGSYDYQDGLLPKNDYTRYIFRPDMTIRLSDKFTVAANFQYTQTLLNQPEGGTDLWQSQSARASPISPIYTKNGQYAVGSSMVGNTIAGLNESGYNKTKTNQLFGVLDLIYSPIKNLVLKGSYSRTSIDQRVSDRVLTYNLYDDNGSVATKKNLVSSLRETSGSAFTNLGQVTADYTYTVKKHNIKALAGFSQEYNRIDTFSAYRDNLPFANINVLNTGSSSNMQNTGTATDVAMRSFFGRINYNYDGKYLLQANFRADGSSRFATGHKWGYFPSFSGGWNISKERFFKVSWVSNLKIRGSWGILGDAAKVKNYATANTLFYNPAIYAFNGAVIPGAYDSLSVNRNISWEEAKQTNVGLDISLFQGKLTASADYFLNKRDRILYPVPASAEYGLPSPLGNLLKLNNTGWEFLLGYRDRAGDFNWGVDANASFSKNKVTDLGGTGPWINGDDTYTNVGTQLSQPYGYQAIGLFKSEQDVANSPSQGPNVFPGNIKYKDINGDNKIDGYDRVILNNKVPIFFGGNLNFGWKNFDVSANFTGSLNGMRYMRGYEGWAFYLSQNARPMALDSWTPQNPDASYPRLSIQNTSNDTKYSSYWLRKADYLKIQNLQLGYSLPSSLLSKAGVSYMRVFLSVQNLATLTNYPGFDPEAGVNQGYYPLARTFAFGLNLKF